MNEETLIIDPILLEAYNNAESFEEIFKLLDDAKINQVQQITKL